MKEAGRTRASVLISGASLAQDWAGFGSVRLSAALFSASDSAAGLGAAL